MRKMKAKMHNGGLGLLPKGGSRKLVGGFEFWGRNGVKMASPLPFLNFFVRHARPNELNFYFLQKPLQNCVCSLLCIFFS